MSGEFTIFLYLVYIIVYTYTYEPYRLFYRFAGLAGLVSQLGEFLQRSVSGFRLDHCDYVVRLRNRMHKRRLIAPRFISRPIVTVHFKQKS